MKYQIIKDLTIKTGAGERLLKAGQVVSLPPGKAEQLVSAGHVRPFCYWLEKPVNDCQMPCSVSKKGLRGTERECPHFTSFLIKAQAGN